VTVSTYHVDVDVDVSSPTSAKKRVYIKNEIYTHTIYK